MANQNAREVRMEELFDAAHKDPHLRMKLLENPKQVAKEWGVVLEDREVSRLLKVGAFLELANEAQSGKLFRCDPRVCYPATVWQKHSLLELIKDLVIDVRIRWKDEIFYPAPDFLKEIDIKLDKRFGFLK